MVQGDLLSIGTIIYVLVTDEFVQFILSFECLIFFVPLDDDPFIII